MEMSCICSELQPGEMNYGYNAKYRRLQTGRGVQSLQGALLPGKGLQSCTFRLGKSNRNKRPYRK